VVIPLRKHPERKRAINAVLLFNKLRLACYASVLDLMIYRTQIRNQPIRSSVYCPDTLRYQVTDLIWLRYQGHLAEFGYGKYLIASAAYLARLVSIAMARPNSPDMPPKRTKKVRLGIKIAW